MGVASALDFSGLDLSGTGVAPVMEEALSAEAFIASVESVVGVAVEASEEESAASSVSDFVLVFVLVLSRGSEEEEHRLLETGASEAFLSSGWD